jgi:uncharacterized membrane protein YtjA (UPF0391 family)
MVFLYPLCGFFSRERRCAGSIGCCRAWNHVCRYPYRNQKTNVMLKWTAIFFVIAVIAAIFGFTDIAAGAAAVAKIIFFIFLVLLVGSLILGAAFFKR